MFRSDPSPLIFSICQYWVLIRLLRLLTNVFLDNTAALRTKSTCKFFFYFVETQYMLSFGSSLFCTLFQHWPPPGESVTQPTPGASISSTAFYIFLMLSCKMTRCLSIWQCSASPRLSVLHALLYETIRSTGVPEERYARVLPKVVLRLKISPDFRSHVRIGTSLLLPSGYDCL